MVGKFFSSWAGFGYEFTAFTATLAPLGTTIADLPTPGVVTDMEKNVAEEQRLLVREPWGKKKTTCVDAIPSLEVAHSQCHEILVVKSQVPEMVGHSTWDWS